MIASEWLAEVRTATSQHFPDSPLRIQVIRSTRIKIRIDIGEDIFADLFFREETGLTDYTLIVADERRYGLDNLVSWHEHPVDKPDSHIPIDEPTPEQALLLLRIAADTFSS